ncbi:unnamed protein product [Oikopleura dioica]|uniref:Uncharacterized protein n=1 Tax=Oikopleura dioica TaxID=34765 RepID=E4XZY3_OIKDI|nr:unnamed protein product [Oikopleura dioica]
MGNYFTTIFPSGRFKEQDCSENPLPKPATGSKTPIMSKADASDAFDPRSPSHNVSRTPLKAEEGHVDILSDPRSPLQEINRTPLAVKENEKKSKASDRDHLRRKAIEKSKAPMPMPSFDDEFDQNETLENYFTNTKTADMQKT